MAKNKEILKLYGQYMGGTPTSSDVSKLSMLPADEVGSILSNSRKDVTSTAVQKAKDAIAALSASMPAGTTGNQEYLQQVAGGKAVLEDAYGLTEAEQNMAQAEDFYRQVAERGPMFEEVMKAGLQNEISPKFLGATRKDIEQYLSAIPNPLVRDQMVNAYLDSADKSLTSSLKALNGLYQTALTSAETGLEIEKSSYQRISDKVKELYSELQWVSRDRWEEQQTEARMKLQSELDINEKAAGGITFEPTNQEQSNLLQAFKQASMGLPTNAAKADAATTFQGYLSKGNIIEAKSYLLNVARQGSDATTRRQVVGREAMMNSLMSIRDNLNEYINKGGSTNILVGTTEEVMQKLGMTTDPELAAIGTRIKQAVADYRLAMTGVQFSDKERQVYDAIFPSWSKDPPLNMANIKSILEGAAVYQENFYSSYMGEENYDSIYGERYNLMTGEGGGINNAQAQQTLDEISKGGGGAGTNIQSPLEGANKWFSNLWSFITK